MTGVQDPYNCTTNPVTGLTSPTTGIVSMYRRPLPSTNLGFLSAIMWDGREPSLSSQAIDATLIHAEADKAPNANQQAQIVTFETGIFTAQTSDNTSDACKKCQFYGAFLGVKGTIATALLPFASANAESSAEVALSCMVPMTWLYVSNVMPTRAWPSRSLATLG